jgi:hypothetical protein
MALGVRYAEIKSSGRDMNNQFAVLRDKLRASLDDAQRGKLAALNDARNLQPIVSDGQCENLVDPSVPVLPSILVLPTPGVVTRRHLGRLQLHRTRLLSPDVPARVGAIPKPLERPGRFDHKL